VTQGTSVIGRAIPFGVGAVFGGVGNNILGRRIVKSSRGAFPAPPSTFPSALNAVVRVPKASRPAKVSKSAKPAKVPNAPRQLGTRRPFALPRRSTPPTLPSLPPPSAEDRQPD
jgi:hypothetical protein